MSPALQQLRFCCRIVFPFASNHRSGDAPPSRAPHNTSPGARPHCWSIVCHTSVQSASCPTLPVQTHNQPHTVPHYRTCAQQQHPDEVPRHTKGLHISAGIPKSTGLRAISSSTHRATSLRGTGSSAHVARPPANSGALTPTGLTRHEKGHAFSHEFCVTERHGLSHANPAAAAVAAVHPPLRQQSTLPRCPRSADTLH